MDGFFKTRRMLNLFYMLRVDVGGSCTHFSVGVNPIILIVTAYIEGWLSKY